jgi:hypothetical protein
LHGDDKGVGRAQNVKGEQIEGWGAVEDDEIEAGENRIECVAQAKGTVFGAGELNIGAGKVLGAGQEPEEADLGGKND